jgi:hypothetical protein
MASENLQRVIKKLQELYPKLHIVLWEKEDKGKLFVNDVPVVKSIALDLLETQLKDTSDEIEKNLVKYFAQYIQLRYIDKVSIRTGKYNRSLKGRVANITRPQMEYAIENSRSNMEAARFLGVCVRTFTRYADFYGLRDSIRRGTYPHGNRGAPFEDIFANKYPNYNITRLKQRLIKEAYLAPVCVECGFAKQRKDGQAPLLLSFIDGNVHNYAFENLRLICYNCAFLNNVKYGIKLTKKFIEQIGKFDNSQEHKPQDEIVDDIFDKFNPKKDE